MVGLVYTTILTTDNKSNYHPNGTPFQNSNP